MLLRSRVSSAQHQKDIPVTQKATPLDWWTSGLTCAPSRCRALYRQHYEVSLCTCEGKFQLGQSGRTRTLELCAQGKASQRQQDGGCPGVRHTMDGLLEPVHAHHL